MHFHRSFATAAAVAASCLLALPAWAQKLIASAASPGNVISVEVQVDGMGKLAYGVKRKGKELIAPSRLGFNLANPAAGWLASHSLMAWPHPMEARPIPRLHRLAAPP